MCGTLRSFLVVVDAKKVSDQLGDVLAAFADRRQIDRDHVEAIIKILAEPSALDLVEKVAIAGGDHPGIDADCLRIADALELVLLEHAQELHLQFRHRGVDFIEKNGAGVGGLEAAGAVVDGPGERPSHVAEKLALQQVLGHGPAVDAHKRPASPRD